MSAPVVCDCCLTGDHIWLDGDRCCCPFCLCDAVRLPAPTEGTQR